MDSPSAQLVQELRAAVSREVSSRRPILHRLNGDTSYLLQLPRAAAAARKPGSKIFYNVLIDPWFVGGQSDSAGWLAQQWHSTKSAVESVREVDRLVRGIEVLARSEWALDDGVVDGYMPHEVTRKDDDGDRNDDDNVDVGIDDGTTLDAVIISHEFTDHCHKQTLLSISPDVPVFAPEAAAALLTTWMHFRTVCTIPVYSRSLHPFDWHSVSIPPLPEWFGLARVEVPGDPLAYHAALVLMFDISLSEPLTSAELLPKRAVDEGSPAHAIIYMPHGTPAAVVTEHLASASPCLKPLALLHGLHEICARGQVLQLGGLNAKEIQERLRADYWIATHDEVKTGVGAVMSRFSTRRKAWTLEQLLERDGRGNNDKRKKLNFTELANGQSIILA